MLLIVFVCFKTKLGKENAKLSYSINTMVCWLVYLTCSSVCSFAHSQRRVHRNHFFFSQGIFRVKLMEFHM